MSVKQIGKVTHYFDKIGVAIVKFDKAFKTGGEVVFGQDGFKQEISSMQFDHKQIEQAKAGQEVGIKVDNATKEGTPVFKA
jgi:translation elongation factor EF-1alpha